MNFLLNKTLEKNRSPLGMFYWPMKVLTIGSTVFFVIASFFIIINIFILIAGESVPGKVVDFERFTSTTTSNSKRMGSTTTVFRPVFGYTYKNFEGRLIASYTDDGDYQLNETVEILVNPFLPNHVAVNNFWDMWFLPIFLSSIGGILLVMSRVIKRLSNEFKVFFKH